MEERKTGRPKSRPPVRWTVFDGAEERRFASDAELLSAFRGRDREAQDVRAAIALVSEVDDGPASKRRSRPRTEGVVDG
jgi:hypothetical protein